MLISLEEWAQKNNQPKRTAQQWAKDGTLRAKMVKTSVWVERKIKKYMIDQDEKCPA